MSLLISDIKQDILVFSSIPPYEYDISFLGWLLYWEELDTELDLFPSLDSHHACLDHHLIRMRRLNIEHMSSLIMVGICYLLVVGLACRQGQVVLLLDQDFTSLGLTFPVAERPGTPQSWALSSTVHS